jgi:hypothetical protein
MTSRKRKLTDDEIEAQVIADLDDPDAWGEPIYVPPSRSPRPAWVAAGRHLELSARFHVLSVLHRLGAEASLTNTHPNNVDITIVHASGRVLTVDVQTLIGTTKWFVRPLSARKHHYVAFVLFAHKAADNPALAPEVLVFPSARLKAALASDANRKLQTIDIQALAREVAIADPWQQLIAAAA